MAASLDWSQCPAVESVTGRCGGAWVLRDTRLPVSIIFENLECGATIEEIIENYDVTREQIQSLLEFVARSADAPVVPPDTQPVRSTSMTKVPKLRTDMDADAFLQQDLSNLDFSQFKPTHFDFEK